MIQEKMTNGTESTLVRRLTHAIFLDFFTKKNRLVSLKMNEQLNKRNQESLMSDLSDIMPLCYFHIQRGKPPIFHDVPIWVA